ncbi:Na+/H+ antiporter subunit G [Alteromonas oceanisediminis]|uniref:Na+/H+ antiporter subunit G n=1 Tax=Alteromonas oceanisediminis TaxID=2836180 RepID=UPI001BD92851|nr:Na+/H+ antiporter subunit G [Alteromonas oceanisediminis]MBT0586018.1 Na+/H+ antiporter subunit G [Alteromonas oceanisediminis]
MSFAVELTISILLLLGGLFVLVGSIGLLRLKDIYVRLHAPTKATTLGLGGILAASMVFLFVQRGYLSINELLITLFLVITAPVTAHILAKVAMHLEVAPVPHTKNKHLLATAREQQPPQLDNEQDTEKDA